MDLVEVNPLLLSGGHYSRGDSSEATIDVAIGLISSSLGNLII
jgi:hypothetical protein